MSLTTYSGDTSVLYGIPPESKETEIIALEREAAEIKDPNIREKMIQLLHAVWTTVGLPTQRMPVGIRSTMVIIDSRDRDTAVYPTTTKYQIQLPCTFKEIYGIRLLRFTYTPSGAGSSKFRFNLFLKNIPSNVVCTNVGGHDCFCTIETESSAETTYTVYEHATEQSQFFSTPLDRLSHFDILWKEGDGEDYAFNSTLDRQLFEFRILHMGLSVP